VPGLARLAWQAAARAGVCHIVKNSLPTCRV